MYYHVWFVTKYRKPILRGKIEKAVKNIFAECIERHRYKVLELETNKDHVHMLLEAENKKELARMLCVLKSVSAKVILDGTPCFPALPAGRRVGNSKKHFWARRYGYREIGEKEIEHIREYIRNQKNIPHG